MEIGYAMRRGFSMGAKYGISEGFRKYLGDDPTPELDESAEQAALGIIFAAGGVLIALYVIAVVTGSFSYAVSSGNIKMSEEWNETITNADTSAAATYNLAGVIPIAVIGVGLLLVVIGAFSGSGI